MTLPGIPIRADIHYLEDRELYEAVIRHGLLDATSSIRVSTANLKNVRVQVGKRYVSIVTIFKKLIAKGLTIRILHAGALSKLFVRDLDRSRLREHPNFQIHCCPRVHFKALIWDDTHLYIGSANLTGAGLGAKSEHRRNFELGLITQSPELLDRVDSFFEMIWCGDFCKGCAHKSEECG
jgi:phosphatidylserine/phosphatidylglycerophosphate/cardiolipin synthase-like enzyme